MFLLVYVFFIFLKNSLCVCVCVYTSGWIISSCSQVTSDPLSGRWDLSLKNVKICWCLLEVIAFRRACCISLCLWQIKSRGNTFSRAMPGCFYWPFTFKGQSCLHLLLTDTEHTDQENDQLLVTIQCFLSILLRHFWNINCEKTDWDYHEVPGIVPSRDAKTYEEVLETNSQNHMAVSCDSEGFC